MPAKILKKFRRVNMGESKKELKKEFYSSVAPSSCGGQESFLVIPIIRRPVARDPFESLWLSFFIMRI